MINNPNIHSCANCDVRFKSVFCNLNSAEVNEVDAHKHGISYKKGEPIFHEGNNPQGIFCINQGKVKLTVTGEQGKEQIIRLAASGDVLGYRSLLSNDHYNATATALDDTEICFISKETFFKLLDNNQNLSRNFLSLLSTELKDVHQRMTDLSQKPVRERIAESLLLIREIYGVESDGQTLNVSLSREDIANLAGTATETTIRTLSDFNSIGIIELVKKKIKILNQKTLIAEANVID